MCVRVCIFFFFFDLHDLSGNFLVKTNLSTVCGTLQTNQIDKTQIISSFSYLKCVFLTAEY